MTKYELIQIAKVIDPIDEHFPDLAIDDQSAQFQWINDLTNIFYPNLPFAPGFADSESFAEAIEAEFPISYDRALRIATYNYTPPQF